MVITTTGAMIFRLASPVRVNRGAADNAVVKGMINPAPRMKSMLKGENAAVSETKRTPPPIPDMGEITPTKKVKTSNASGQNHQFPPPEVLGWSPAKAAGAASNTAKRQNSPITCKR